MNLKVVTIALLILHCTCPGLGHPTNNQDGIFLEKLVNEFKHLKEEVTTLRQKYDHLQSSLSNQIQSTLELKSDETQTSVLQPMIGHHTLNVSGMFTL